MWINGQTLTGLTRDRKRRKKTSSQRGWQRKETNFFFCRGGEPWCCTGQRRKSLRAFPTLLAANPPLYEFDYAGAGIERLIAIVSFGDYLYDHTTPVGPVYSLFSQVAGGNRRARCPSSAAVGLPVSTSEALLRPLVYESGPNPLISSMCPKLYNLNSPRNDKLRVPYQFLERSSQPVGPTSQQKNTSRPQHPSPGGKGRSTAPGPMRRISNRSGAWPTCGGRTSGKVFWNYTSGRHKRTRR